MSDDACNCGCSTMTTITEAEEACQCGCECCASTEVSREDEIAELHRVRASADARLKQLQSS